MTTFVIIYLAGILPVWSALIGRRYYPKPQRWHSGGGTSIVR